MFFLGRPPAPHPAERGENGEKNWGVLALRTYLPRRPSLTSRAARFPGFPGGAPGGYPPYPPQGPRPF